MRLDAANEVDDRFWKQLRPLAKGLDPDMWIVGEIWGDASHWLQGDMWDSTMNYQFRDACLRFVAEGRSKPSEFANSLMRVYSSYAPQVSRNLMNLLGSHDTARFLTLCKGNEDLARLGAVLQFTWVGTPSIYYGDEIGMQGGADPDNRRGMAWNLVRDDNPMLRYYRRLVAIRNASPALQSGDPDILRANDSDDTLLFSRSARDEEALIAVNRSDQPQTVSLPSPTTRMLESVRKLGWIDMISGQQFGPGRTHNLALGPLQAAVLLPATSAHIHLAAALGTPIAEARHHLALPSSNHQELRS